MAVFPVDAYQYTKRFIERSVAPSLRNKITSKEITERMNQHTTNILQKRRGGISYRAFERKGLLDTPHYICDQVLSVPNCSSDPHEGSSDFYNSTTPRMTSENIESAMREVGIPDNLIVTNSIQEFRNANDEIIKNYSHKLDDVIRILEEKGYTKVDLLR